MNDAPWCGEGSQYPTMPLTIGRYMPGLRPLWSMFMQNMSVEDDIATCVQKNHVSISFTYLRILLSGRRLVHEFHAQIPVCDRFRRL